MPNTLVGCYNKIENEVGANLMNKANIKSSEAPKKIRKSFFNNQIPKFKLNQLHKDTTCSQKSLLAPSNHNIRNQNTVSAFFGFYNLLKIILRDP